MSEATDRWSVLLVLAFLAHAAALPTWAQTEITDEPWRALRDGTRITRYTMTNARGARARFMPLGAAILSVEAPDRNGTLADVVLGFDTGAPGGRHQAFVFPIRR
jgi:aldose 1-epimerase